MSKHIAKLFVFLLTLAAAAAVRAAHPLDIYWIDMEGGAGTLIVTPAGESVLIDTGNPGGTNTDSSAVRIHKAAVAAGVDKIDYLILTHFHIDHYGGAGDLAKLMPIGKVLDNSIPEHDSDGVTNNDARWTRSIQSYRDFKADSRSVIQPGQVIPLKQSGDTAALTLFCVGTRKQYLIPSYVPTNTVNPVCAEAVEQVLGAPHNAKVTDAQVAELLAKTAHDVDTTDNANSVVSLLKFGPFKFFVGGDLTWNMEGKLVCPFNPVGTVDLYQVDHHGLNLSNNPLLVRSLAPIVTVMSNGPRKGAMPETLATLRSVPSIQTMWQIHRNTLGGSNYNTDFQYIANLPVQCEGNYIKCSVDPTGKSYTVSIPATGVSKTYQTVLDRPY
ncbi:MAG: MBL fold metallo-hydrolase [Verrucomicrobiota bacterium]|jgi:beta-lactamase superfamily II metal-dependent hydrolase